MPFNNEYFYVFSPFIDLPDEINPIKNQIARLMYLTLASHSYMEEEDSDTATGTINLKILRPWSLKKRRDAFNSLKEIGIVSEKHYDSKTGNLDFVIHYDIVSEKYGHLADLPGGRNHG